MITLQVSLDCADPHRLWRFWAGVLDIPLVWADVEPFLAVGMATHDEIIDLDGRRAWARAVSLIDPNGR